MPQKQIGQSHEFGPLMQKLEVQAQVFVCMLFAGLDSVTKAAEQAGYSAPTRNALRATAHRLLHRADVERAVVEEAKRRTSFLMPKAQAALEHLLDHPEHQDHFKAVKAVREETFGPAAVRKIVDMSVNITVSDNDKIKAIREFAVSHGIDPKKFLGFDAKPEPVDADFMTPEEEAELRELGVIS
jgi:phage terminase small subunit